MMTRSVLCLVFLMLLVNGLPAADDADVLDKISRGEELTETEQDHARSLYREWGPANGRILRKVINGGVLDSRERARIKQLREDWLLSEHSTSGHTAGSRYRPEEYQLRRQQGSRQTRGLSGSGRHGANHLLAIPMLAVLAGLSIIVYVYIRKTIRNNLISRDTVSEYHEG